jgi:hypothetical protein
MPKVKSGNFTLKRIVAAIPAHQAAHRFTALQKSGRYSELRFVQRGKSAFDIVGYAWPDKGVRRKFGIGRARKNPDQFAPGDLVSIRVLDKNKRLLWIEGQVKKILGHDDAGRPAYEVLYELEGQERTKAVFASDIQPAKFERMPNKRPSSGTYKVGEVVKHVWREKKRVKFQRSGKYGMPLRNLCPKTANPAAELAEAVRLSKKFTGFMPRKLHRIDIRWPKASALIGPCVRLDYYSTKWDHKGRVYYHEFEKPCQVFAAAKPQPDGDNLLIIKGKFQIRPEGITG